MQNYSKPDVKFFGAKQILAGFMTKSSGRQAAGKRNPR
jgi:hypothetical protein